MLTGFVVERAAKTVTIEDGQQGRTTVPKSNIKQLRASAVSRMPEGLLDGMTPEQIRDLFAYLRSKPNKGFVTIMEWQNPPYSLTDESTSWISAWSACCSGHALGRKPDQGVIAKKHAALVELRLVP